jgi:energy-coupling factor transporter ATP-binding protein EcfA2
MKSGGLLVITGLKASGKTRLAESILGRDHPKSRLSYDDEKARGRLLNSVESTAFFDDADLTRRVSYQAKKAIEVPLDSPAIESAIDRGILVVITGIRVTLVAALEMRAVRIHLGHNATMEQPPLTKNDEI